MTAVISKWFPNGRISARFVLPVCLLILTLATLLLSIAADNLLVLLAASAFLLLATVVATARPEVACVIVIVTAIVFAVGVPNFGAPFIVKSLSAVALLTFTLVARLRVGSVDVKIPERFLVAFIIYGVFLALFRSDFDLAYLGSLQIAAVLPLVLLLPCLGTKEIRIVAMSLVSIAVFESFMGLLEVLNLIEPAWGYLGASFQSQLVNNLVPSASTRAIGTMAHPIPYGLLCAVSLVIVYCTGIIGKIIPRLTVMVVLTMGILLSGSRSAAVGAVVGLILAYFAISAKSYSRIFRIVTAVSLAMVALAFSSLSELFGFANSSNSMSVTHRQDGWLAIPSILNRDFGDVLFGLPLTQDTLIGDLAYLTSGIEAIDNQWIYALLKLGIFGLVLLAVPFIALLINGSVQRSVGVVLLILSFSFDAVSWNITAVLVAFVLYLPDSLLRTHGDPSSRSGGSFQQSPREVVV